MPKYDFYYRNPALSIKEYVRLGEIDYPLELKVGDAVSIGENLLGKIRESGSQIAHQQFWIREIVHPLDPVGPPIVRLVDELPN